MARVSIFVITAALIAGMAGCDGDGYTPSQDLEIRTWYDLDDVRDNLAGNHNLMNDLDSTTPGYEELASPTANGGKGWQPIGFIDLRYGYAGPGPFGGTFDGQGYEICDLYINRPDEDYVGLFGVVYQDGVIKNVGVVNATVTGSHSVGGLLGSNAATVSNCYCSGKVTGDEYVGGLVGLIIVNGVVMDSYSTDNVIGNLQVGGLVGRSTGIVSNSFWDIETSGQASSADGTGKTTAEMKDIITFLDAGWNIIAVALNQTNPAYIWNIVDNVTYPFLSWQPA
jgi:hypothetical protein